MVVDGWPSTDSSHGGGGWLAGWLVVHQPDTVVAGWLAGRPPPTLPRWWWLASWLAGRPPTLPRWWWLASWLAGRPPTLPRWWWLADWLAVHLPSHSGGGWLDGWLVVHQPATAGRLAGWSSTSQPKGGEGAGFWICYFLLFKIVIVFVVLVPGCATVSRIVILSFQM